MFAFRKPLKIGYCTTCGWCTIQLYGDIFIWSFIFEFPIRFGYNARGLVPYLIALRLDLEPPNRQLAIFLFTPNMLVKKHSDFLALGLSTGVDLKYINWLKTQFNE